MIDDWYEQEREFLKRIKNACHPDRWPADLDDNRILQELYSKLTSSWDIEGPEHYELGVIVTGTEHWIRVPRIWIEDYAAMMNHDE